MLGRNKEEISLKRFIKIWFSGEPDVPLPQRNIQRIDDIVKQYPDAKICLVLASSLLSSIAMKKLSEFEEKYKANVEMLDIDSSAIINSLDQEETELLKIAKIEMRHKYGNLAAASDIIRWFKPILAKGVYSDFDVFFHYQDCVINCCFHADFENEINKFEKYLEANPGRNLHFIYDNCINSDKEIEILKNFKNKYTSQVNLKPLTLYLQKLSPRERMYFYGIRKKNISDDEAKHVKDMLSDSSLIAMNGILLSITDHLPMTLNGIINDVDFILPIDLYFDNINELTTANNVVAFRDINHPLIKLVQCAILSAYTLKNGAIKFTLEQHEKNYGHLKFESVFKFRKHVLHKNNLIDYRYRCLSTKLSPQ